MVIGIIPFLNGNRQMGGARHSVRAVVVNLNAVVGNSGGQRPARPTSRTDYLWELGDC